MLDPGSNSELPVIPAKRYFTIGEVSDLCAVKHALGRPEVVVVDARSSGRFADTEP